MSMGCAVKASSGKKHTGGFQATREFGSLLGEKFPDLDLSGVDTDGAAVIIEITDPKKLHLHKLSRFLTRAAEGGVKAAVISIPSRGLLTAIPLFNLFMAVDEGAQLKDLQRLERAMSTGV